MAVGQVGPSPAVPLGPQRLTALLVAPGENAEEHQSWSFSHGKAQGSWGQQKADGDAMHAYSSRNTVLPLPEVGHGGSPTLLWLGLATRGASRELCSCNSNCLTTRDPHPSALRFCFAWSKRCRKPSSSTAWLYFCRAARAAAGPAITPRAGRKNAAWGAGRGGQWGRETSLKPLARVIHWQPRSYEALPHGQPLRRRRNVTLGLGNTACGQQGGRGAGLRGVPSSAWRVSADVPSSGHRGARRESLGRGVDTAPGGL